MANSIHTALERLLSKIQFDTNGGCWLYAGYWMPAGYGQFYVHRGDPVLAHRASWLLHFGPIPEGMNVCHRCDTPPCFRPDHLFLGTHADNVADKIAKARDVPPPILRGEANFNTALSAADVIQMRRLYAVGSTSQQAIADRYGISQSCVSSIVRRQVWDHV